MIRSIAKALFLFALAGIVTPAFAESKLPTAFVCTGQGEQGMKHPDPIRFEIRVNDVNGSEDLVWTETSIAQGTHHSFTMPVLEVVPYVPGDGFKVIGTFVGTAQPNPLVYQLFWPSFCENAGCLKILQITDGQGFQRSYTPTCERTARN